MTGPHQGYALREGDGFLTSVRELIGSVKRWDEMRVGLDWALHRNPTDPSFATHLVGGFWVAELTSYPSVIVFYEVDQDARAVTYFRVVANV